MASALDELRAYTEALRGVAKSARDLDELLHTVDANLTPVVEKLEKFSEVMSKATASRAGWLFRRGRRRRLCWGLFCALGVV